MLHRHASRRSSARRHPATADIWAAPDKDWSTGAAALDASDRGSAIAVRHWPVKGLLQPDAIAAYTFRGMTYLVTANEGDSRSDDKASSPKE